MPDALPGLFLGQSDAAQPENLLFNRANRHGVVAGATGPEMAADDIYVLDDAGPVRGRLPGPARADAQPENLGDRAVVVMLDVEHPGGEVGAGAFDSGFLAQEGGQRHAERTGNGVQRVEGRISLSTF